jgi:hypothetical protein
MAIKEGNFIKEVAGPVILRVVRGKQQIASRKALVKRYSLSYKSI